VWDWKNKEKKELIQKTADGKILTNYNSEIYTNKKEWENAYGLFNNKPTELINSGDIPAPFKVALNSVAANTTLRVADNEIVILEDCIDLFGIVRLVW
jgi:hypothetical protein